MSARFAPFDARPSASARLDVRIDALSEASLDDVARLYAARESVALDRARAFWQRAWDRREEPGGKTTFVAVAGGSIVAYASVRYIVPSGAPPDARVACPAGWYLAGLVVDEQLRRRGIASQLVRHRLAWLAEHGATECFYVANEHNRATIALHERFAFTQIARDVWLPSVTFEGGAGLLFRAAVEPVGKRLSF